MRHQRRYLTLIRHAKSSWNHPGLADFERPLNKRGQRDAPFMGQWLEKSDVDFDLILSSPANRALATARLIAAETGYPEERIATEAAIYEAGIAALQGVIGELDHDVESVALVGHNPGISALANTLAREPVGDLPTCAVIRLAFSATSWQVIKPGKGTVISYDTPRRLREKIAG